MTPPRAPSRRVYSPSSSERLDKVIIRTFTHNLFQEPVAFIFCVRAWRLPPATSFTTELLGLPRSPLARGRFRAQPPHIAHHLSWRALRTFSFSRSRSARCPPLVSPSGWTSLSRRCTRARVARSTLTRTRGVERTRRTRTRAARRQRRIIRRRIRITTAAKKRMSTRTTRPPQRQG